MGLIDFDKLPVNNLVGADWHTYRIITSGKEIDKGFRLKHGLTTAVCRLLSIFAPIQEYRYKKLLADKPLEQAPVFILGHWRSGTTFVHNVLSCDKHFAYNTTYQTVFPHLMMFGQPFFKKTMSWLMPSKRPTDNMELAVDLPQEEEFSLTNSMPFTYYNLWYFPKHWMEYAEKYLVFNDVPKEVLERFEEELKKVMKIAIWNTGGTQFLSKNPPHTARVKELLDIFPDAKFIYLIRNPYTVFESTRSFYTNTMKSLKVQDIAPEELAENILNVYNMVYDKYEAEKSLIPKGNLFEMKFEDFEKDPMGMTEKIYAQLQLSGLEAAKPSIEQYLNSKKGYKKNQYSYKPETVRLVNENWMRAIEQWGYEKLQDKS